MTEASGQKIANAGLLASLMVVGIHVIGNRAVDSLVKCWDQISRFGFFRIAVPFFFVCSGYFLALHVEESGWYRTACCKRIKSL